MHACPWSRHVATHVTVVALYLRELTSASLAGELGV